MKRGADIPPPLTKRKKIPEPLPAIREPTGEIPQRPRAILPPPRDIREPLRDIREPLRDILPPLRDIREPLIHLLPPLSDIPEPLRDIPAPLRDIPPPPPPSPPSRATRNLSGRGVREAIAGDFIDPLALLRASPRFSVSFHEDRRAVRRRAFARCARPPRRRGRRVLARRPARP